MLSGVSLSQLNAKKRIMGSLEGQESVGQVNLSQPRAVLGSASTLPSCQDENDQEVIFKVVRLHPNFCPNVMNSRPECSKNFIGKVLIAVLDKDNIQRVHEIVKNIKVDNNTVEWDCQEYVLDILDSLEAEFIMEEDNKDYHEARKKLKENWNHRWGLENHAGDIVWPQITMHKYTLNLLEWSAGGRKMADKFCEQRGLKRGQQKVLKIFDSKDQLSAPSKVPSYIFAIFTTNTTKQHPVQAWEGS
uniref:Uncharacterized protein n=1 Tax=Coccidioides posadasii RMSCC 3488 TaxID=454284 RepID=A0A0J6F7G5_COCPO|nr:hypothetical protein CPAG_05249 [Coccidioides posadasii RMSCC 3488]